MRVKATLFTAVLAMAFLAGCASSTRPSAGVTGDPSPPEPAGMTRTHWKIQSSAVASAGGATISSPGLDTSGWFPTPVPTTVLAALVRNGDVPDPFEGRNLETMATERFLVPWWYRSEFSLPAVPADARLVLEGINYSAEVWLNGERVAGRDELTGSFRVFELDVTARLRAGTNVLAVEVFPPKPGDPTIGFVDWNPSPPDRSMGIWREVALKTTDGVSLDEVWVRGDVDPKRLDEARIGIGAKLANRTGRRLTTVVQGRIAPGDIAVRREVTLEPGETRELSLGPEDDPQLLLANPRLWWPNNLGEPSLYTLELEAVLDGRVSDRHETNFGIRHIADFIDERGHRGYAINGRPVLIRGGGWVDDVLLVEDFQRLEDQIRYVRHMNLNTIRLEGFWGNTHRLFDLADRYGIMVWVGWSCQWEWKEYLEQPVDETWGGIDTAEEMDLIARSLRDQVIRLRNHPSVVVWNLSSDLLPHPDLERRYLAELGRIDPTRPALAACSTKTSEVSGPTGVKMNGPYEWVPPNYWYEERAPGGAFGFNTETGPGAQPPVAASIRRMLPETSWWPIDEMWNYHAGRHEFRNLDRFVAALDARYGPAADLEEFSLKSQMVNRESMRAMFEAFSLRRPVATGIVQWMMSSAWPKVFWQLYDYYLMPTGAFYGARDSGRPVHIAYDYGTAAIVAVNDSARELQARARVRIFDARSRVLFDEVRPLQVPAGARHQVLVLPQEISNAFRFVDARIVAEDGALLDANFYWLPGRPDVLDWDRGTWFYTPVKELADLKAINELPKVELDVDPRFVAAGEDTAAEVTLRNPSPHLAFFVELEVAGSKSGRPAAPIFWDDNYVSLAPGETRTVRATIPSHALNGEEPVLRYRGINVQENRR